MTTHLMLFSEHPPLCVVHEDHDDKWVCCLPCWQMKTFPPFAFRPDRVIHEARRVRLVGKD